MHQEELEKESSKLAEMTTRLKWQETKFQESVAALGAAGRLSQQIDVKDNFIRSLRDDGESFWLLSDLNSKVDICLPSQTVTRKEKELSVTRKEIAQLKASQEGKVDKQVIKSLVLGYFSSPADKKHEVERLLARILDFSQEEMDKANLKIPSSKRGSQQNESLASMFVQFLQNESTPTTSEPLTSHSSSSLTLQAPPSPQVSLVSPQALLVSPPTPSPSNSKNSSGKNSPVKSNHR